MLRWFLQEIDNVVRNSSSESEVLRKGRTVMEELLLTKPESLPELVFAPRRDRYAMNLIHTPNDRAYSANGATWLPGQSTPIHDHLTWAIVGLYDGEERESIYRRTDDGSNPKVAELELASEKINQRGHITVLGRAGIHRIDNVSISPSKSIHVYGVDVGNEERHSYNPVTGEISKFVSGYCNILREEDLD